MENYITDPSIWAGAENGISRYDAAVRQRVYFEKGNNDRIPGWMQCHYRLAFDENGYPMMYVFNTCRAFIRTVPLLTFDPHAAEDLDSGMEDHAADEWRYFCMMNPIKPRMHHDAPTALGDPFNRAGRKRS